MTSDIQPTNHAVRWRQVTDDVVVMSFPLHRFGVDFRRIVTLLRLTDGRVVVHSTAPFTEQDVAAIRRFGEPTWLVEATLVHDTFAKEGHAAFPGLPYLAPQGFARMSGVATESLDPPPSAWAGEIEVLRIGGVRVNDHAFFHRRSRTLVVADLFFSLPAGTRGWPRFFVQHFMRLPRLFGIGAIYRFFVVRDREAFTRSMMAMLRWDFDRLVVAHWEPIETGARSVVERALRDYGM